MTAAAEAYSMPLRRQVTSVKKLLDADATAASVTA
jgi:hypothetical protein